MPSQELSRSNSNGNVVPFQNQGQSQQGFPYPQRPQQYPGSQQSADFSGTNYNEHFEQLAAQNKAMAQHLQATHAKNEHLESEMAQQKQILDRLKGVFNPEAPKEKTNRIDNYNAKVDAILSAELEARKHNRSMPITTQIGNDLYSSLIEQTQLNESLQMEMQKLKQQVQNLNNPSYQMDQRAYSLMENVLIREIEKLYGNYNPADQNGNDQRDMVKQGVIASINKSIGTLQKQSPQGWEMLRRDEHRLVQAVKKHLEKILPPKAVQDMRLQRMKNAPITKGELLQALAEAQQLPDSPEKSRIISDIRGDILSGNSFGNKEKSLNDVYIR